MIIERTTSESRAIKVANKAQHVVNSKRTKIEVKPDAYGYFNVDAKCGSQADAGLLKAFTAGLDIN